MKEIMKSIKKNLSIFISIMLICTFSISCSKDKETPVTNTPIDPSASLKGDFVSAAHPTSGTATVNKEKTAINFTNFKTDNGPELVVYLVSNLSKVESDFINLGKNKGVNGNYTYDLSANTDLTVYKHVVIWCNSPAKVSFGHATLAP
jgi:hypothetical protein